MKNIFFILLVSISLLACTHGDKENVKLSKDSSTQNTPALPESLPFTLSLRGENFTAQTETSTIKALSKEAQEQSFKFKSNNGKQYTVQMKYKALPNNRSFPSNLDITLKNSQGEKLGYLFFAINHIAFLKEMGDFGLVVNDNGKLIDVHFDFDEISGDLALSDLENERFVQDTLLPSQNFQMIRPVVLERKGNKLSKGFALDAHPFEVNYTIEQIKEGVVQFQHNLYSTNGESKELLERVYYNAGSLKSLREGMFAGKYFDKEYGAFKLVFYPAMGQTEPQ